MMPITGAGIFGFGMMATLYVPSTSRRSEGKYTDISSSLPIQLYLVDAFRYAASALAAATVGDNVRPVGLSSRLMSQIQIAGHSLCIWFRVPPIRTADV